MSKEREMVVLFLRRCGFVVILWGPDSELRVYAR